MTCPLATVCVLLLDLVVTLAKFYWVLFFSIEFTRALFETLLPMIIHDIYSVLTSAFHSSQVRKPFLDSTTALGHIIPKGRGV